MPAIAVVTKAINGDATKLATDDDEWSTTSLLIGLAMGMMCLLSFLLVWTMCCGSSKEKKEENEKPAEKVPLPTGTTETPEKAPIEKPLEKTPEAPKPTYLDVGPPAEEPVIIPALLQDNQQQPAAAAANKDEDADHYIEIGHKSNKGTGPALPADQVPGRTPAYRTMVATNSIFESSNVKKTGATTTIGPMTVADMKTAITTQSNIKSVRKGTPSMAPPVATGSMAPAGPSASVIQKKGTATMAPQAPSIIQKKATATLKAQYPPAPAASMKAQLPPAVASPKKGTASFAY